MSKPNQSTLDTIDRLRRAMAFLFDGLVRAVEDAEKRKVTKPEGEA